MIEILQNIHETRVLMENKSAISKASMRFNTILFFIGNKKRCDLTFALYNQAMVLESLSVIR